MYHVPTNRVYVGPFDHFHMDMFNNSSHPEMRDNYMEEYGRPSFGWGGRLNHQGQFHWYENWREPAQVPSHIKEHIEEKMPQYIKENWPAGEFDDAYEHKLETDPDAVSLGGTPQRDKQPTQTDNSDEAFWSEQGGDSLWEDDPEPQHSRFANAEIRVDDTKADPFTHAERGRNHSFLGRIPFRWHPPSGTVFLGHPGYYHHDIPGAAEYRGQGVLRDGYIWTDSNTVDFYTPYPPEEEQTAIRRALSGHLSRPLSPHNPATYSDDSFWEHME